MGSILWIPIVFGLASLGLYNLSVNFPENKNGNSTQLKFPTNVDDLHTVASFLHQYKTDHVGYVMVLFICAYLYKQTFAIPGSVFLNILAGALFGTWLGFPLVCVLTATGASFCYFLTKSCGRNYVVKYFPEKVQFFQKKVEENLESLFFFLLFLRLFPMSPNWFMNMVAPIVNVPIHLFFPSVLIGLMPYNFICVQTGCMLSEIKSMDDMFTVWTLVKLGVMASAALVPGFLIKKVHGQHEKLD